MEISFFLAKAWGLFFVLVAGSLLLNKKSLKHLLRAAEDEKFLLATGFLSLLVGVLTVSAHNVWTFDWKGLLTLFGWLALLKGVMRIGWPELAPRILKSLGKNTNTLTGMLLVTLVLGLYLLSVGFSG